MTKKWDDKENCSWLSKAEARKEKGYTRVKKEKQTENVCALQVQIRVIKVLDYTMSFDRRRQIKCALLKQLQLLIGRKFRLISSYITESLVDMWNESFILLLLGL